MPLAEVEATIHLPGLPFRARAIADTSAPYVADALERGHLIVVGVPEEREAEADAPGSE